MALVVGLVWLAVRFRDEVWRGLLELIESIRRLFGGTVPAGGVPHRRAGPGAPRASGRIPGPFATGMADGWSVERVVQETFNRLRARDRERPGSARAGGPEETPWEFAERLAANEPELAADLFPVARAYVSWAYGGRPPAEQVREHCVALWSRMPS